MPNGRAARASARPAPDATRFDALAVLVYSDPQDRDATFASIGPCKSDADDPRDGDGVARGLDRVEVPVFAPYGRWALGKRGFFPRDRDANVGDGFQERNHCFVKASRRDSRPQGGTERWRPKPEGLTFRENGVIVTAHAN